MPVTKKIKKNKKTSQKIIIRPLLRHEDLPATIGLVYETRSELIAEIETVHSNMRATEKRLSTQIHAVDQKVTGVENKVDSLKNKVGSLENKVDTMRGAINELDKKMNGGMDKLDGRMDKLDGRMDKLDGRMDKFDLRMNGFEIRMDGFESTLHQVLASTHRTQALVEEQRSENRIVLDGIKSVMERQDKTEFETKELRTILFNLRPT